MKMTIMLVLSALMSARPVICHGADVFYLTNAVAHTNYGPFEYAHGEKLTIGNQTLEIRRLLTDDERLKYRLQKIVVPEIDFRGSSLSNVVAFFQLAAAEWERDTDEGTNVIRFVVERELDQEISGAEDKELDYGMMRFVSLYAAVRAVCHIGDLDFRIQNGAVVFVKRKEMKGQQPAGERRDEPAPHP